MCLYCIFYTVYYAILEVEERHVGERALVGGLLDLLEAGVAAHRDGDLVPYLHRCLRKRTSPGEMHQIINVVT